jgi:hypothetical protein
MQDMHHIPEDDHEAAMARADLYKLAQYSAKLFKMIHEGQQLEGWVQAKITKSADYIASVYHFMAYEMKVSEYGEALENAEVYESELRSHLQNRLVEAKEKVVVSAKAPKQSATMLAIAAKRGCTYAEAEAWIADKMLAELAE